MRRSPSLPRSLLTLIPTHPSPCTSNPVPVETFRIDPSRIEVLMQRAILSRHLPPSMPSYRHALIEIHVQRGILLRHLYLPNPFVLRSILVSISTYRSSQHVKTLVHRSLFRSLVVSIPPCLARPFHDISFYRDVHKPHKRCPRSIDARYGWHNTSLGARARRCLSYKLWSYTTLWHMITHC